MDALLREKKEGKTRAMARTPKVVEDRREQILEAAIRVFARKGFHQTINSDIAREAGITSGLIYYYFQSKEEMLQAIVETRSPMRLMRSLPLQALDMSPAEFFPFLLPQVLEIVESEPIVSLLRIFLPELLLHAEVLEPLRTQGSDQIVAFFRGYYTRQQELGQVDSQVDPTFQAQMTISCLVGFFLRRQIVGDPTVTHYSHQELTTLLTTTLLKGIEAR
jgi:AcrR family transcriptional regulator